MTAALFVIGIVVSEADIASTRIGEAILDVADWDEHVDPSRSVADGGGEFYRYDEFELRTFETIHLELVNVADAFTDPTLIVFVSRHAGETGPLLTTHFPGNVGNAAYGGNPNEVPLAAPSALKSIHSALKRTVPDDFAVGIECTHHGPSRVGSPCLFAEVGSGPSEWEDRQAAKAVANAVLSLETAPDSTDRVLVGIGGAHYCPRYTRILEATDWQIGHVAADWSLDEVPESQREQVIKQLFDQSGASFAVFDRDDPELADAVSAWGYRVVSERWVRESTGVDLRTVATIEELIGPIDEGTRIGEDVPEDDGALHMCTLNEQLVGAAEAVNRAETVNAVAQTTCAYGTIENGNRLTGEILLAESASIRTVVAELVAMLSRDYDSVTVEEDELILTRSTFRPALASDLGVPEGPAFGQLAAGETVMVEGKKVTPAEVTKMITERIPIKA